MKMTELNEMTAALVARARAFDRQYAYKDAKRLCEKCREAKKAKGEQKR